MALKISQQLKILSLIEEPYRGFFEIHNRLFSKSSTRHVAVISPSKFDSFLWTFMEDEHIPEDFRLAVGLTLSGGTRATETLNLRRFDLEIDDKGLIFAHIKVLKKKKQITRPILVHPAVATRLKTYMIKRRGLEKLFTFGRSSFLKNIKRYVGSVMDLHSLRHSHISMLILHQGMAIPEVAKLMEISVTIIQNAYFHMDARAKLEGLWEIKKIA